MRKSDARVGGLAGPRAWLVPVGGIAVVGAVGVACAAAGAYGAGLWHAIAAAMILLASATAALAGLALVARGDLVPLGWLVLLAAPVEAGTLLAANWQEHVGETHAAVLVTLTVFLLAGLAVSTLRLLAGPSLGFRLVAATTAALVVLGLAVVWTHSLPPEALTAILSLVFLTVLLYSSALVARHSGPAERG